MDYCLGDGDGSATMWSAELKFDADDDGVYDAIGLDFDGDGRLDDALTDSDGDGTADHLLVDVDDDDHPEASFTDDGSGTWAVGAQIRWLGLGGVELTGGPLVDFDGDGQVDDRVVDADRDGLADRALVGDEAYVDVDADGRWDLKLVDSDGDGAADAASQL
ncbi:pullulanase [Mycobacterium sp. NPDC006124]|uniref:pullulanase n=1 Tax=Mycobacterium sp. NPDC006124 TaxID=3156729 RepID=UPI0033AEF0C9